MDIQGEIKFRHGKVNIRLSEPTDVTDAFRQAGLLLNTRCAGKGICGGCAIDLLEGTFLYEDREIVVQPEHPLRVHGCKTKILCGPFRISVLRRSLVETGEQVVADFVLKDYTTFDPTIRQFKITLPKPTLGHSRSDFELLTEELRNKHHLEITYANISALRDLPGAVKEGNYHIIVSLAWINDKWELLAVEPMKDSASPHAFGLAVDIGTTTIAVSLVDLTLGKILDTATCYNQQIRQADDVAARIVLASTPQGRIQLQQLIINETIDPLIHMLCRRHKIDNHKILRMVVSGNTVMWHLFLAIDPTPIGTVPFQPACRDPKTFRAAELGLSIYPHAPVDIVPSISAYVGGDIVSDIETTQLTKSKHLTLLIDVGTNGEIALTDGQKILVTACAAGPAFEGLRITYGMRAGTGAIEHITLAEGGKKCRYKTIGQSKPIGICGSGLIDFLAQAFKTGLITSAGRFNRDLAAQCRRLKSVAGSSAMMQYVVAEREETEDALHEITITEKDIETILQAKAAVFSAIRILLHRLGKNIGDLQTVYLAGGFARYINIENAIMIGLLPEIDINRYVVIGNGSLAGAFLALIDRNIWPAFRKIIDTPEVVELNLDPNFQDEYTFALFLPNMQDELFNKTITGLATT